MTSATTALATHLWSAGMTYQGAHLVLVADRQSEYAFMYRPQCARSARSAAENFQCLSGRWSRSRNRRFCSPFETFRKNLRMTVPLRTRWRSNALMSW